METPVDSGGDPELQPLTIPQGSNLLILSDINRDEFETWKNATNDLLEGLEKWVELPSFRRVLMIFDTEFRAANALDLLKSQFPHLHIFMGPNMPLDARPSYLALPDAGKLWFTSPPASPPNEWEQSVEEPPNTDTNFDRAFNDQLNVALLKYRAQLEGSQTSDTTEVCVLHAGDDTIPKLQVTFYEKATENINLPKTALPPSKGS